MRRVKVNVQTAPDVTKAGGPRVFPMSLRKNLWSRHILNARIFAINRLVYNAPIRRIPMARPCRKLAIFS